MKYLLLLRHAKSSWAEEGGSDHDRPLAPRGIHDAPLIGKALRKQKILPDIIICSTALRARQTAEAVLKAADISIEPEYADSLYAASASAIISTVRSIKDTSRCALLVGHNPGFEEILERLTGKSLTMPTGALACIQLPINTWEDLEDGEGSLKRLILPRELDDFEGK